MKIVRMEKAILSMKLNRSDQCCVLQALIVYVRVQSTYDITREWSRHYEGHCYDFHLVAVPRLTFPDEINDARVLLNGKIVDRIRLASWVIYF